MTLARIDANLLTDNAPLARGLLGVDILGNFRNKLINGDFDNWQRGASISVTTSGQYHVDRWNWEFGESRTRTVSQQAHTLGQTTVPGNPRYFMRVNQSVAGSGTGFNQISQRIEGVQTLAGKTVTLTLYAKFGTASTIPGLFVYQVFGSGGSPSASVQAYVDQNIAVGTSFQKIQYVFTVPSISGKVLGTNNDDYLAIYFQVSTSIVFTLDISHFSIVEGDASKEADPFSPRHIQQELALCQRYYETGRAIWSGMTTTGSTYYDNGYFKVSKRSTPTLIGTYINGASGFGASAPSLSAFGSPPFNVIGFQAGRTATSTVSTGYHEYSWTADAEL